MPSFRDQAMLELSDPAAFTTLLRPAGNLDRRLIETMLAAAYDLSAVRIDQVKDVAVGELELQRPLFGSDRLTGNWTQTMPAYTRTDLALDRVGSRSPTWIDVLARLQITVVAEIDPAGAESVTTEPVEGFTTLEDFRQRFPSLDLDAFMAERGIRTVDELRDAFQYVATTVRLRAGAPFDPHDPANVRTLDVPLATVAIDPFDLTEGLRAARLIQEAARSLAGRAAAGAPPVATAPYAPAVVFSAAGPTGAGITADAVVRLFAKAGVTALFLNTS